MRETFPARTATEQLLISTAADRAIDSLDLSACKGKKVFVETTNLESYDKPYVNQRIASRVLHAGGMAVSDAKEAEIIVKVASGGLSIDERHFLIGIPAIPVPVPGVGSILTPELAIFKILHHYGKAKILVNAVDPKSNVLLWDTPLSYGNSKASYLWLLLTGPWQWGDNTTD